MILRTAWALLPFAVWLDVWLHQAVTAPAVTLLAITLCAAAALCILARRPVPVSSGMRLPIIVRLRERIGVDSSQPTPPDRQRPQRPRAPTTAAHCRRFAGARS
ncbi:hypothetical protein [Curtobacterium ammoniigenes]|uniref:hypothetical protein n=1 Tax=Curtobacterium ammoniigenes TaxID=395387 RepID=UPI000834B168|nr:hypothetical protein [Curtobacterium ammoniigenes]